MALISKIALALSVGLVASSSPTEVINQEQVISYQNYQKGTGYVAFGDSFTRGYGASLNNQEEVRRIDTTVNPNSRNVKGSFSYLLATDLGLYAPDNILDSKAQYWPIAHDAITLSYILDLLGIDDGFVDNYIYDMHVIDGRYKTDLAYFGSAESYAFGGVNKYGKTGAAYDVRKLVEDATLISIELGLADILLRPYEIYLYKKDLSNAKLIASATTNFIKEVYEGIDYFKYAYKLLLSYVKKANPDVDVVIVGATNPFQDVVISEGSLISIGQSISLAVDELNAYYRSCAKEYGYMFADIYNIETWTSEKGLSIKEVLAYEDTNIVSHPSYEGYAQIERIIKGLIDDKILEASKTDIKVDLGRFKKVDYVTLDGKTITDYTIDDNNRLVINNKSKVNKSLSVSVIEENGDISFTTYSLTYYENSGYSVKKIYTANTVVSKVVNKAKQVVSSIKSLFKK